MANIDFENLKQKITETATTVVGKTTDVAKSVAGKAQHLAKKTKLNAEIASEREGMKKRYQELGRLYYDKYAGSADPDFAEPVSQIGEALERIAAKQAEIDALDAEPEVQDAEVEPETEPDHIVDEVEPTPEAEAEQTAAMAEEAAQEAQRLYEQNAAADEPKE